MDPGSGAGPAPFRLGPWRIFPDRYELRGDDDTVRRVQPLLIALLQRLTQAGDQTVSRDELLASVWQRRHVNDEVLSRAIADLRRALDDDARQPRLIETVPKLGYRMLMAAQPLPRTDAAAGAASPPGERQRVDHKRRPWLFAAFAAAALLVAVVVWKLGGTSSMPGPEPADMVHARPLVSDPGWSMTPRFSRNGQLIAYSAADPDTGVARIRVRSRDGRIASTVENQGQWDICPLFSHDGVDLFWTRHDNDSCRLMRVALAGGAPHELAACARGVRSCPDLTPDGGAITFTAPSDDDEPHAGGLVALRWADGALTRLSVPTAARTNDADPRYSQDGRHLAFLRGRSSARRIVISDADGANPRIVPLSDARIYGITWLDDRHLLAATDSEGFRALIRLDIHDGTRSLLGAAGARYPDRANDGALVWEMAHYQSNLWLVGSDGSERQLTHHRRSDGGQVVSPDGRSVAFQSNREGLDAIWLLSLDSGEERRLPLPADAVWAHPAWSPDGQTLLLTRYRGLLSDVWSYRLGSSSPKRMARIPAGAHAAQYAPDETHVWYLRTSPDGERRLWRSLLTGTDEPSSPLDGPVDTFLTHRSGLYVQRSETAGLWRCAADGTACRKLPSPNGSPVDTNYSWTLTDATLYRQNTDDEGNAVIWRTPVAGGPSERVTWPASTSRSGLAVLPDDTAAVIDRGSLIQLELGWLPPAAQREQ